MLIIEATDASTSAETAVTVPEPEVSVPVLTENVLPMT